MMQQAFANCRVLQDGVLRENHAVIVEGGRIADILPAARLSSATPRHDLAGAILAPGLIDIQVNGGGGVLFNDTPTVEAIRAIGAAHARYGTTGFLPTLISTDLATIARAMDAVDAAIAAGVPGVLGIHVEGPFLSSARKGIHDDAHFRPLDAEAFSLLTRKRRGCVLLTLAPEAVPAAMIRALAEAGVLVCAGHSDADFATVYEGLKAGIRGFTHLFNAMRPLQSREPGPIAAALESPAAWYGLIVDGWHVSPATLRLALRGCGHPMLVTDAMATVGGHQSTFHLYGSEINVVDGRCLRSDGTLAGAALDMAAAVRNCARLLHVPLTDALRFASRNPAEFIGVGHFLGRLAPGYRADVVAIDPGPIAVLATWVAGKEEFLAEA